MNETDNMNKGEIILYQPDNSIQLEVRLEDETVWLSQIQMAELFQTTVPNINLHLKNIFEEGELEEIPTIKDFLIVRQEGKRQVQRSISAHTSVILIDNYIDESVLLLLSKRNPAVSATVYTAQVSAQLQQDLQRHNAQYPPITVQPFNRSHDRFLLIDGDIYHIGASLKDLGKKWFAFTKMNTPANVLLQQI